MSNQRGLIFDVQGFSVHDGPGSRTTVFLSGCPLKCTWCANPEGREFKQQLLFSKQKCQCKTGCRRCENACSLGAIEITETGIKRNNSICKDCTTFDCASACYREALRLSGKWYTVPELMKILKRDRQFWENGGVTFSGGEPLMQKDFMLEVLLACKEEGIHTAVETTAYIKKEDFLRLMAYVDFAFIDVKQMEKEKHKAKTQVDNRLILENIKDLKLSGWPGRLVLRMPVIEEYNDSVDNITATILYMQKNDLHEINILPFHRMGDSKWTQLGFVYEHRNELPTERKKLEDIQKMFEESGLNCYIGDEMTY